MEHGSMMMPAYAPPSHGVRGPTPEAIYSVPISVLSQITDNAFRSLKGLSVTDINQNLGLLLGMFTQRIRPSPMNASYHAYF
jgi:hypothetical protein